MGSNIWEAGRVQLRAQNRTSTHCRPRSPGLNSIVFLRSRPRNSRPVLLQESGVWDPCTLLCLNQRIPTSIRPQIWVPITHSEIEAGFRPQVRRIPEPPAPTPPPPPLKDASLAPHPFLKDPGSGPRYLSGFKGPRSSALAPAQDPVIFAPGSSHSEPAVGERGLQTLCVD